MSLRSMESLRPCLAWNSPEAVRGSVEAVRVSVKAVRVLIEALRCFRGRERLEEVPENVN